MRSKMVRMAQWSWRPKRCLMEPFDPLRLSRRLAGRKVVFVGDSIAWQQFRSLQRLMCPDEGRCTVSTALDPQPFMCHFVTVNDAVIYIQVMSHCTCTCTCT